MGKEDVEEGSRCVMDGEVSVTFLQVWNEPPLQWEGGQGDERTKGPKGCVGSLAEPLGHICMFIFFALKTHIIPLPIIIIITFWLVSLYQVLK